MSTKKTTIIDLESIINRLKGHYKISEDLELSKILGMKKGNFSAKKLSGTLINDITQFCILNKIDCNKILLGQPEGYKHKITKELDNWLESKSSDPEKAEIWFSIDYEAYFTEFLDWRSSQKQRLQDNSVSRKIA